LADAQTSGGLLLAVDPDKADDLLSFFRESNAPHAAVIGRVVEEPVGEIKVV